MYMLIMVLDDISRLNEILAVWEGKGIVGVTILESTGLHRVMLRHRPQAAYAGFGRIFGGVAPAHNTLFAVVDRFEIVEAVVAATEEIVGKLDNPHTGIMFALPVSHVWGMPHSPDAPGTEQAR